MIIQNSILHGILSVTSGFYHPNLITDLCKLVGVKWNKKEELCLPKVIIDNALVYKIKDNDEDVPRASGASTLQEKCLLVRVMIFNKSSYNFY